MRSVCNAIPSRYHDQDIFRNPYWLYRQIVSANIKKDPNTMTDKFQNIDLALEKIVFLYNAEEGNPGIYELTWELSYYDLTIEEKYKIAHIILTDLIAQGFVVLDKYSDITLQNKIGTISQVDTEIILNNPAFWYPCNEIVSITLTEKGKVYLYDNIPKFGTRLTERWKGKIK
jgi:hypothetical protein